jgi:uncharacterized protein (TIGR03067 family)
MSRIGWAALAAGLLLGGDDPARWESGDEAIGQEMARFQGTWQLISAVSNGEETPAERVRQITVTIKGNTHTVRFGDRVIAHDVTFAIDPLKTPREVTDTIPEGPDRGKQILGIYALEGDTLTSCVAPVGKDRPAEFASRPGSGHTLRVFRRVQGDGKDKATAIADELQRFEGTWRYESTVVQGQRLPDETFKDARLILKGDRFEMTDPMNSHRGTFTVDPTATPRTIDVAFSDGPQAGKIRKGIYELDETTYRACFGLPGRERPEAFVSEPGNGQVLQVLRRVEP